MYIIVEKTTQYIGDTIIWVACCFMGKGGIDPFKDGSSIEGHDQ